MVSHSIKAAVIASTLLECARSIDNASAYCSSKMRRISASTRCCVASETTRLKLILPELSFSTYTMGPSASVMPNLATMSRANAVARSKSFDAPVLRACKKTSSAARPPNKIVISSKMLLAYLEYLSCSGNCHVTPKAQPRGMMVTLCTGSALGNRPATTAWPDSW